MSVRPRWEWALLGVDGEPAERVGPAFTARFDAEQWIGEHWRDLAAQGVRQARLLHEGAPVGASLDLARPSAPA
ncbi:MAG: hypothetical protein FWD18_03065 [Micrococcales bacterium]|nr:hypothetical protein [Micrococcales bacterium]